MDDVTANDSAANRARLVRFLLHLSPEMTNLLAKLKQNGENQRDRPDFLWHFLLQSFGTMGNSHGWQKLKKPEYYERISYDALAVLNPTERKDRLDTTLHAAGVRMAKKKAEWLAEDFLIIEGMGGMASATAQAFAQPGTEGKIAFMKRFAGIGDKYGRNIWMDVYHPEFRNTIAIDQRIKGISDELGMRSRHTPNMRRITSAWPETRS